MTNSPRPTGRVTAAAEDMVAGQDTDMRRKTGDKAAQPSLRARRLAAGRGYNPLVYILWFLLTDFLAMAVLQMSVSPSNPWGQLWAFLRLCVTQHRFVWALNMAVLALIYLAILFLFNRFWVASPVFLAVVTVVAVIERMKVQMRNEPILPSDVLLAGDNAGSLTDFIPDDAAGTIIAAVVFVLVFVALCVVLGLFDGHKGAIFTRDSFSRCVAGLARSHGQGAATATRRALRVIAQIVLVALPAGLLGGFAVNLGTEGTAANRFAAYMGDIPHLWDAVLDAQGNGTAIGFMRLTRIKVMDEPKGYSEQTMKKIAAKYTKVAKTINASRMGTLTNNTVITVLSESYSDPTRVPGVSLNADPMPRIRAIKKTTTSGLMVSSGYGGGTANLEYMATTGLSMANFSASMTAPYTQLVPTQSWPYAFSQMWNQADRTALAFHPYNAKMYFRDSDYKRFGFAKFWAQTGTPYVFEPQNKIDRNPYVCDASSYQAILDHLAKDQKAGYYQLATMQNHMNYNNWYDDNQFQVSGTGLSATEKTHIRTYAKGVEYTDKATKDFLDKLDAIDRPITVIWYGDHLPGIYDTASRSEKNSLALHETDYFIWSNKATKNAKKLSAAGSAYTSPNYFMAQAAAQTDSKVSPYLAFLTRMHEAIPAMEPPVMNGIQVWDRIPEGEQLNVMSDGKTVTTAKLPKKASALLREYRLIQYDMTAGKNYLRSTDFVRLPSGSGASSKTASSSSAR
jgi:phosphoglycerol transferase MdoB-like AlkP superfamily enzyme